MKIEDLDAQIRALKDEKKVMSVRDSLKESASYVYDMYEAFLEAGFTEEQAWNLTTISFTAASER